MDYGDFTLSTARVAHANSSLAYRVEGRHEGPDPVSVLQPAQLLQRLRLFQRRWRYAGNFLQCFRPVGIDPDMLVIIGFCMNGMGERLK